MSGRVFAVRRSSSTSVRFAPFFGGWEGPTTQNRIRPFWARQAYPCRWSLGC